MEGKLDPLGDGKIELRVGEVEKIHIFYKRDCSQSLK